MTEKTNRLISDIKEHIIIDTETLGINPSSAITQIGAVKIDVEKQTILDTFIINVSWPEKDLVRYDVNYDTVLWWLSQSEAARKTLFEKNNGIERLPINKAIKNLFKWIGPNTKKYIYWNHLDFDAAAIKQACFTEGVYYSISYKQSQHLRTLEYAVELVTGKNLRDETKRLFEKELSNITGHFALDDALRESYQVMTGIELLIK